MDKIGLLKMAVRITYPKNSLTPEEQENTDGEHLTRTLYFYDNDDPEQYRAIMAKAWRPGATATTYSYAVLEHHSESIKADRKRGEWLPFDAEFTQPVMENHSETKRDNRYRFY